MDAVVISAREALTVEDRPLPACAPGQVLLRVGYVGICGSDLHYYFDGANGAFVVTEPLVPGHEVSGWVAHDPSGALAEGAPVTVHPARFGQRTPALAEAPHLWPGGSYLGSASTTPHTQGAMAAYVTVEASMVRPLPDTLPVRRAVLAEPLAVALHGASRAGEMTGARVLVCGAGPIGLLAAVAARARGAASVEVSDLLPEALERASAVGADRVWRVGVDAIPDDAYDVVLECSGAAAAVSTAIAAVRRRGTVVQIGMLPNEPRPVNLAPLVAKEATLRGAFRFLDEMEEAIGLLDAQPAVESVITHEFSPREAVAAFETARRSAVSAKVVVAFTGAGATEG
ncbi:zinc-binding dehydrogenase [Microbacterium hominis]|uniref:zinc-binding dehydrogenase n=1 Tax=Microbacterium TaxID=33882 RepID=UPI00168BA26E|nr:MULTISPECIES: zinc-binding dehydrogenase [Microbacterium]QOC25097.1 zinc-binding dehydrogenase [Microbacterium hominis]QOC29140.1 zinc-binding dehydrogenase [Microbacterium hominis]QYF98643.1 zinc-binding dehydrogenase [Microbacterium sp. PAMC21962]